jgi:hypothetical protein
VDTEILEEPVASIFRTSSSKQWYLPTILHGLTSQITTICHESLKSYINGGINNYNIIIGTQKQISNYTCKQETINGNTKSMEEKDITEII